MTRLAASKATFHSSLASLLAEHGLSDPLADQAAARLIGEYPLARRVGERALAQRLEEWGLERAAAAEAAVELLAFELLGRLSYERVLAMVEERAEPKLALGACLRAAQLRRTVRGGPKLEEPGRLRARLVRYALQWLR